MFALGEAALGIEATSFWYHPELVEGLDNKRYSE